jgi:xanthine/uracil permease
MKILTFILRRLLLPTVIATVVGRFAFNIAQTGALNVSETFVDTTDAFYTVVMVFIILLATALVALPLHRFDLPLSVRIPVLLATAAGSGFALVLYLTEVVAYAELVYAPAVACCIVWMLCNLDLLKRAKKG